MFVCQTLAIFIARTVFASSLSGSSTRPLRQLARDPVTLLVLIVDFP